MTFDDDTIFIFFFHHYAYPGSEAFTGLKNSTVAG